MLQIKRVMTKQVEEDLINTLLEQVRKNDMTISNLKEVTLKVINYLESNAILDLEDSDNTESSI
ncbi:hypothetical protein GOQ29_08195 [Clostridium sp. D2Q-14]|uniref:hypothetical protein n=1 Tax=Anaeromonas gelatinilytica TaxID=2683194 RepID=UPI00193B0036|nr:hypothetical protein [Anaeromonas gelatinilytica]MBS4535603.1 hypothetical protein [Anaeromonas gelatinilytica]